MFVINVAMNVPFKSAETVVFAVTQGVAERKKLNRAKSEPSASTAVSRWKRKGGEDCEIDLQMIGDGMPMPPSLSRGILTIALTDGQNPTQSFSVRIN